MAGMMVTRNVFSLGTLYLENKMFMLSLTSHEEQVGLGQLCLMTKMFMILVASARLYSLLCWSVPLKSVSFSTNVRFIIGD